MNTPLEFWPELRLSDLGRLNETTEQVHQAAQYLSMAGKFFIPHEADDSHTNMGWNLIRARFEGHRLPTGHQMALHPESMSLILLDPQGKETAVLSLAGKTWADGVKWVRETLAPLGMPVDAYEIDLHYDLPDHEIHHGAPFRVPDVAAYRTFSKVRSIGQMVMKQGTARFPHAGPVRTWPHHFDTGSYIPLAFDATGEPLVSISAGLAIADAYAEEYYFYIRHWPEADDDTYSSLVQLPNGGYWNRKDFTGALLRFSDLLQTDSPAQQFGRVSVFIQEALRASLHLLGVDSQRYFP